MSKIAIVIDSTSYIPMELLKDLPIFIIHLYVVWNGKSYQDIIDLNSKDFYERLATESEMPKTSQASPEEFIALYRKLLDEGYEIISVHVSRKFTSTIESAYHACEVLQGAPIYVFDSESAAMGMGLQVLAAARAAKAGADAQQCLRILEKSREQSYVCFVLSTLEFLRRGGRIGGAAALLGGILQFKPILEVRNGMVGAIDRVRTMSKAMERLVQIVQKKTIRAASIQLAVMHSNALPLAQMLLDMLRKALGDQRLSDTIITDISPTLGTHLGPGGVGIAYLVENVV